jgi:hypothetical protein
LGGLTSIPGDIEGAVVLLFGLSLASLANDKPPDEEKEHGESDHTSDHTTSDSTDIGAFGRGCSIG